MTLTKKEAAKKLMDLRKRFAGFIDCQSLFAPQEDMDNLHDVEGTLFVVAKGLDPKAQVG